MCEWGNTVVLDVPPTTDIRFNCDESKPKTRVTVDRCLAPEIRTLWHVGIRTTGCCCGHGGSGFIGVVDDDIPAMELLGYEHAPHPTYPERRDNFIPKTKVPDGISPPRHWPQL